MVVAPTLIPSLRSSPEILTHPHLEFSRVIRRTSAWTSGSRGGLPGLLPRPKVHFLRTSSRCHRRSVLGVTMNEPHRSRGRTRLAEASSTRSRRRSLGRPAFRRRTRT